MSRQDGLHKVATSHLIAELLSRIGVALSPGPRNRQSVKDMHLCAHQLAATRQRASGVKAPPEADEWEAKLAAFMKKRRGEWVTVPTLFAQVLPHGSPPPSRTEQMRLACVMERIGCSKTRRRFEGRRRYAYQLERTRPKVP